VISTIYNFGFYFLVICIGSYTNNTVSNLPPSHARQENFDFSKKTMYQAEIKKICNTKNRKILQHHFVCIRNPPDRIVANLAGVCEHRFCKTQVLYQLFSFVQNKKPQKHWVDSHNDVTKKIMSLRQSTD